MITCIKNVGAGMSIASEQLLVGKSTDVKPLGVLADTFPPIKIMNGAILYEMDTKISYMYDEEDSKWHDM